MMDLNRTAEKCMERLNGLLLRKKAILSGILELTRKQFVALSENGRENIDSLDKLEKLINEKQTKIDEIDRIDEEFEQYYTSLKSSLGMPSAAVGAGSGRGDIFKPGTDIFAGAVLQSEGPLGEGAKKLKALTGEILGVITEISGIEKENSRMSQSILGQIGNEIKKINQGKKADSAYKPTSAISPSYFIDKKK